MCQIASTLVGCTLSQAASLKTAALADLVSPVPNPDSTVLPNRLNADAQTAEFFPHMDVCGMCPKPNCGYLFGQGNGLASRLDWSDVHRQFPTCPKCQGDIWKITVPESNSASSSSPGSAVPIAMVWIFSGTSIFQQWLLSPELVPLLLNHNSLHQEDIPDHLRGFVDGDLYKHLAEQGFGLGLRDVIVSLSIDGVNPYSFTSAGATSQSLYPVGLRIHNLPPEIQSQHPFFPIVALCSMKPSSLEYFLKYTMAELSGWAAGSSSALSSSFR